MSVPAAPVAALMALDSTDLDSVTTADAPGIMQMLKQLRGWNDVFEAALTNKLAALYESGSGAPAADVHTRNQNCSAKEARAKERRGKALEDAESFGDALAEGEITAEHADALANATGKLDEQLKDEFLGHEESLLDEAKNSSPEDFARHCRSLLDRIKKDHGIERAKRQRDKTRLGRRIDADGMYRLTAELHPELGAKVWNAIDAEVAALLASRNDRGVDRQQLAAEALGNLVSGGFQAKHPAKTEVSVLVDLDSMITGLHEHSVCELSDGTMLPVEAVRRLCCDADIIPIVLNGDSVPVDQGRAQRRANRKQRRQLRAIYRTCAFHGCDVTFDRCEIHHIDYWELGGTTDIDNMAPLCSRHHHVVHEGGWTLELATDRTLTITQPDGQIYAECGPHIRIRPPDGRLGSGTNRPPPDTIDPLHNGRLVPDPKRHTHQAPLFA